MAWARHKDSRLSFEVLMKEPPPTMSVAEERAVLQEAAVAEFLEPETLSFQP